MAFWLLRLIPLNGCREDDTVVRFTASENPDGWGLPLVSEGPLLRVIGVEAAALVAATGIPDSGRNAIDKVFFLCYNSDT